MNNRNRSTLQLLCAAALLTVGSASAHHSAAMYDAANEITLAGTVKEFQWTSPHCWIQVLVPDPNDPSPEPVEWGIEMDNPLGLMRNGWKPGSLRPGDEIIVVARPLHDGGNGAQVVSVTLSDGTPVGNP